MHSQTVNLRRIDARNSSLEPYSSAELTSMIKITTGSITKIILYVAKKNVDLENLSNPSEIVRE